MDVPEAPVELTEHGLVCKGDGWFVVNAREMRWYESEGWGRFSNFGGGIEPGTARDEAYARFPPRTPVRYGGWLDGLS